MTDKATGIFALAKRHEVLVMVAERKLFAIVSSVGILVTADEERVLDTFRRMLQVFMNKHGLPECPLLVIEDDRGAEAIAFGVDDSRTILTGDGAALYGVAQETVLLRYADMSGRMQ